MDSPQYALYKYLRSIPQNSVLIFDEIDMLKGLNLLEDFSAILRSFYSTSYSQGEQRISILIVSYLPPMYYIENQLGSPFNVGRHILLSNFNRQEAEGLLKLIDPPITTKEGDSIHSLFGGHPFMLQLAVINPAINYFA